MVISREDKIVCIFREPLVLFFRNSQFYLKIVFFNGLFNDARKAFEVALALDDIIMGTVLQSLHGDLLVALPSNHNYRNVKAVLLDSLDHLHAIHSRETIIENHNREVFLCKEVEALSPILYRDNLHLSIEPLESPFCQ